MPWPFTPIRPKVAQKFEAQHNDANHSGNLVTYLKQATLPHYTNQGQMDPLTTNSPQRRRKWIVGKVGVLRMAV